jgi:hypothetical protein
MNSIASLFSITLIVTSVAGFAPMISHPNAMNHRIPTYRSPTSHNAIMFEPPAEENCELDGSDCEESVFARKRREKSEANAATVERYQRQGIALTEVDLMETVDQYQNAPTGGNLIPGVSLSALCEDD